MSFIELYNFCQTLSTPVSRKHIRPKACELAGVTIRHLHREKVPFGMRGYFVSSSLPGHVAVNVGENIIVTERDQSDEWDRFIFTKELMHIFDTPEERVSSSEILERVLNELFGAEDACPQSQSETKAFWMALMVLCPEHKRQEFIQQKQKNQIDDYGIAAALEIPEHAARFLTLPLFDKKLAEILNEDASASNVVPIIKTAIKSE